MKTIISIFVVLFVVGCGTANSGVEITDVNKIEVGLEVTSNGDLVGTIMGVGERRLVDRLVVILWTGKYIMGLELNSGNVVGSHHVGTGENEWISVQVCEALEIPHIYSDGDQYGLGSPTKLFLVGERVRTTSSDCEVCDSSGGCEMSVDPVEGPAHYDNLQLR